MVQLHFAHVDIDFATWTDTRQHRHASFANWNNETAPGEVTTDLLFGDRVESRSAEVEPKRKAAATINFPGLTSVHRVLFPDANFTKGDVAAYLYQVNQWMLPHVANRPLSLLRCPEGITGETYFQRHPTKGFPAEIVPLKVDDENDSLLSLEDAAGILATAQISAIELHPWGCRSESIERPDRMIVDLDPDETLSWNAVIEAAFIVRTALQKDELSSFVKTTGGKGLHLVVPLTGKTHWDDVFAYSKRLAERLAADHKSVFVANMSKSRRRGKIFIDYHRNRRGSTAIAAYSLRARSGRNTSYLG